MLYYQESIFRQAGFGDNASTSSLIVGAAKLLATLAAVDCDAHKSLCDAHGVSGFPAIKAFLAGREKGSAYAPETYAGSRDEEGITRFCEDSQHIF